MRPIKFLRFLRQFAVLVQRNLQLIWNDKLLLASLALQSPFYGAGGQADGGSQLLYLQPCQHRQPHGALYSGRHGHVYGYAELLPGNLQGP